MVASMATTALIILSLSVYGTTGQSDCLKDADCMRNQYCYDISHICVNYTRCNFYNRQNGSEPARGPRQCGPCLPKYSAERNLNGGEAESCIKVPETEKADQTSTHSNWIVTLSCVVLFIVVSLCIVILSCRFCKRRKICCYKPEDVPEKSAIPMLQHMITDASAPPLPLTRNNNNYGNAEEERVPLSHRHHSRIGEHYGNIKTDAHKPVKAQPFRPPRWVNPDPNYNPEDGQAVITMQRDEANTAATIDEETVSSVWTPTQQPSLTETNRPFAITTENEENTTNTTLDNARTYPSSPNSEERRYQSPRGGSRYSSQGASTSNSETNNGSRGGNGRENPHTTGIINQIQVNFFNKNSSGEGN